MSIWKPCWIAAGAVAVAGLTLGAALEDPDNTWTGARGQVVVFDDDGERHENTWVMQGEDRGWLGVMLREAREEGALIMDIIEGSPAEASGLEPGDIITGVDGDAIRSPRDVTRALRDRRPGEQVELQVRRDGSDRDLTVELGESPDRFAFFFGEDGDHFLHDFTIDGEALEEQMERLHEQLEDMDFHVAIPEFNFHFEGFGRPRLGIQVVQATPELREHLGGSRDAGVIVGKVHRDSPAEEAGLQVGDLIVAVDGDPVSDAGEISRALRRAEGGGVELEVVRDGRRITVQAIIPEPEEPRRFAPSQPLRAPVLEAPTPQRT